MVNAVITSVKPCLMHISLKNSNVHGSNNIDVYINIIGLEQEKHYNLFGSSHIPLFLTYTGTRKITRHTCTLKEIISQTD